MGDYNSYPRNVLNTPHPMYGSLPGFTIADLPSSGQDGLVAFNAITGNTTSSVVNAGANAIELAATFSDDATTCSIGVYKQDGTTLLTQFDNVSATNCDNLYVGFFKQRLLLGGQPLIFKATNWSGSGTLTLKVRKTG